MNKWTNKWPWHTAQFFIFWYWIRTWLWESDLLSYLRCASWLENSPADTGSLTDAQSSCYLLQHLPKHFLWKGWDWGGSSVPLMHAGSAPPPAPEVWETSGSVGPRENLRAMAGIAFPPRALRSWLQLGARPHSQEEPGAAPSPAASCPLWVLPGWEGDAESLAPP